MNQDISAMYSWSKFISINKSSKIVTVLTKVKHSPHIQLQNWKVNETESKVLEWNAGVEVCWNEKCYRTGFAMSLGLF